MYNFIKYCFSITVPVFSYMNTFDGAYFKYWVICAAASSLYSLYWDVFQDWGFFKRNEPNSANAGRPSPKNYAVKPIVLNSLFRSTWIFTISDIVMLEWLQDKMQIVVCVISVIELCRRSMWNNYRVVYELQQIQTTRITLQSCNSLSSESKNMKKTPKSFKERIKEFNLQTLSEKSHNILSNSPTNVQ